MVSGAGLSEHETVAFAGTSRILFKNKLVDGSPPLTFVQKKILYKIKLSEYNCSLYFSAPIAQLVRALPSHGRGQWFESTWAHQTFRTLLAAATESYLKPVVYRFFLCLKSGFYFFISFTFFHPAISIYFFSIYLFGQPFYFPSLLGFITLQCFFSS